MRHARQLTTTTCSPHGLVLEKSQPRSTMRDSTSHGMAFVSCACSSSASVKQVAFLPLSRYEPSESLTSVN